MKFSGCTKERFLQYIIGVKKAFELPIKIKWNENKNRFQFIYIDENNHQIITEVDLIEFGDNTWGVNLLKKEGNCFDYYYFKKKFYSKLAKINTV